MLCTSGTYYRQNNECIPCPQNPELIIVGAVSALVILCIVMRELDKRKFNLAFVSIGWDYFQVLALFADADIRWPELLKQVFRALSFFNLDIDLVAPECLVPDLPYRHKFIATMLLPIIVIVFLFVAWAFNLFWDRCVKENRASKRANFRLQTFQLSFLACTSCT